MSFTDFAAAVAAGRRPAELTPSLEALWYDAQGAWAEAHTRIQDERSREAAWVHAYLHRKEGDEANAGYWYRRAGRSPERGALPDEWRQIALALTAG